MRPSSPEFRSSASEELREVEENTADGGPDGYFVLSARPTRSDGICSRRRTDFVRQDAALLLKVVEQAAKLTRVGFARQAESESVPDALAGRGSGLSQNAFRKRARCFYEDGIVQ